MPTRVFLASLATILSALLPHSASATLGEPESTVQSDAVPIKGTVKMAQRGGIKVHEITAASGTVVREFAGSDGLVFAVAWRGPMLPNLEQTLGKYFNNYQTAAALHSSSGHRQLQIHQSDLVVMSSGHMRAFSGFAYLPQAIPAGVDVESLR